MTKQLQPEGVTISTSGHRLYTRRVGKIFLLDFVHLQSFIHLNGRNSKMKTNFIDDLQRIEHPSCATLYVESGVVNQ